MENCYKCGHSKSSKEHRKCYDTLYKEDGRRKQYRNRYFKKQKGTLKYRLRMVKKSAKNRGIYFNLTPKDITIPIHCPVLGIELCTTNDKPMDNSPSIDRIDNSKGYIPGNIKVISFRANKLKNNATIKELEAVIRYMEHNL